MKSKILIYSLIIVVFLFVNSYTSTTLEQKNEVLTKSVISALSQRHYQPKKFDDSLSVMLYKQFLKKIDFGKRFLTQEDIKVLNQYKYNLDDELRVPTFEFFDKSISLLKTRLELTKTFYKELLDKEFEFKTKESVEMDPDKLDYAKDEADLKENWRKVLKYEVLTRIVEQEESQEKAIANKDTSVKIKTYAEIEKESREKVKKRYDEMFHRIDKLDNDDRFADYINALTEVYDPHTNYFPPKDKEDFDINMSGSLEGIGAQLSQRDEYIRVERIIPGSPSWKQGELKEGDIILKVAQGSDEPVDVVDMRLDDAVRLIRGKKGTEVRLTVKKTDGTIKKITLIRDIIKLEETFAKSAVINPSGGNDEIGYIKLPSFYADFNDKGGRRSAYDMKQELIKLKNENISGLIIDLRDNGGGSLDDVVDIAGFFIDRGPVVQVHSRNENPYIREDYVPNVYWNGP